jgi:DNA-binding transcriptional LysR family regulator
MTPAISSHRALADRLFLEHGIVPANVIEADNEAVIRSLVAAGLGVALMREDVARELVHAGEACIWSDVRLATTLQFIWRNERSGDPVTTALLEMVHLAWPESGAAGPSAG